MAQSAYARLTDRIGQEVARQLERAERGPVGALRRARARLDRLLPRLPALPLVDRLPSAATVVEANFALAERVLRAQKSFTLELLDALRREEPKKARSPRPSTPGA
jgi:hypothetical protein